MCTLTPVAHVTPACDVTVGVRRREAPGLGQTHRPHEVRLLDLDHNKPNQYRPIGPDRQSAALLCVRDLRVQLHHADVVVDHGPVVARVDDDGAHGATLPVDARVVQVVESQHHRPQIRTLSPGDTHTHEQINEPHLGTRSSLEVS